MPAPRALAGAVVRHEPLDPLLAGMHLVAGPGWPHADTADALRPLAEHGAADHAGTFLVVVGDVVIGDVGWFGPPDADGVVEVGYGLAAPSRRQGWGTAAVRELLDWVQQQPGVRLVTAEVLAGNEPSLRLLVRLGFVEQGSTAPYARLVRPVG